MTCVVLFGLMATRLNKHYYYYYYNCSWNSLLRLLEAILTVLSKHINKTIFKCQIIQYVHVMHKRVTEVNQNSEGST